MSNPMSISNNVPGTRPVVLVIGARGALGALVADAFRRHGWAVRQSSRDPIPPPDFHYVDLTDPATLAPALDGVDLVITTVPDPTLAAERHVLKRGGVLLNLSAGPATALRSLRREAGQAKGTVVMNAGIAPGVTNLLAAQLLEDNPGADEAELVFTVTAKGTGGAASADFAHRGFTGQGHHRVKQVTLPEPFGSRRVLGFAEPDGGWLGPMADGLTVRPYICLAERSLGAMMRTLNAVRLISKLPRAALGPAGVQPWRRPAVNQWRTWSQYCAKGGAWITGSWSVKATSGWQRQAASCLPRHSSAGTVASPRNRALGTPRRCSRLTEWRRPCAGRESMSPRPTTIGRAQPPSADQEGRMFAPRSVPACVPVSHAPGSGPQARFKPRAPLARIVEDIACRGALLTKTMYGIVRRSLHGHYALPVACRAEIPVRRHDHGHQVNRD